MCYGNVSSSISNNNNNNINSSKQIMSNNSIKDNFRTPLTPLHRGGRERLHYCGLEKLCRCTINELHRGGLRRLHWFRLDRFCDNTLRYAFSLIELSIVLIIIGLLVAGVTGGKSLIESAKQRAFINELKEYERAVWTFRAARDRWPGDRDNLGKFGSGSGYTYSKTDFDEPYKSGTFVPDAISAPFVELYTEGITDFKPTGNEGVNINSGKGFPKMDSIKDISCQYYHHASNVGSGSYFLSDTKIGDINIRCPYKSWNESTGLDPKMNKKIDEKMDDGIYNTGIIRSYCYGAKNVGYNTYDNAENSKKKCGSIEFDLQLNN